MTICLSVLHRRGRGAAGRANALVWAAIACAALVGCKTGIDASALQPSGNDEKTREMTSTDDVKGPMERFVDAMGFGGSDKKKKMQLVNPPGAMVAFHKGEDLMKQKQYDEAAKIFQKEVIDKYPDYPITEDAWFLSGECFYLTERYAKAQDKYDKVVKDFPSTRHMDEISRRKFEIARIWLEFPPIITASDVKPVNFEQPSQTPLPQTGYKEPSGLTYTIPILPNFTDKRRPLFDTQGRALDALKSIWLNDPTGPLADDALMLSASYYLRKGDYVEADHLYELLRKEFPKSQHVENAYVLGAHVKLMSYQGPEYGGTELEEAEKLKKDILKLYPKRPDRERTEQELQMIRKAKAARIWADVKYWKSKRLPKAVAISCKEVIKKFPDTEYAQLARGELAKINPEDKKDVQHKVYEEAPKTGKAAVGDTPGVFNEPDSPPKKVPSGEDSSEQPNR
jgi:TolA-binding protein